MSKATDTITIYCNGTSRSLKAGTSLSTLLESLNLPAGNLVIEINQQIIQPDEYETLELGDGDRVELIRFVGGG